MQLNQLSDYVKDRFDMSLCDFIKYKTEVEGPYDYQTAKILNVWSGVVGRLRKTYGIKKASRSLARFEKTYGKGSIDTFKKMIEEPYSTLAEVGKHFGFSRENARIVYKKIYGASYTEIHQKRKRQGENTGKNRGKIDYCRLD